MARIIKVSTKWWHEEREISESADCINTIINDNKEEQAYFDLILSTFERYDESNRTYINKNFLADIDFIIQCAITSLTSSEHSQRLVKCIDAYFYIYRRVTEYNAYDRQSDSSLKEFQEKLLQELGNIFKLTKGSISILSTTSKDLIKHINIQQHLAAVTEFIDLENLHILFALCNLSFQSFLLIEDYVHLQWIDIFSKIHQWKISLTDFVLQYMEYKLAFEKFPLDISSLIYLIRVIHPSGTIEESPFLIFQDILSQLNLDHREFFDEFLILFGNGIKNNFYKLSHIAPLLQMLSVRDERLFNQYLYIYSSNTCTNSIWNMFLYLNTTENFNQIMQKYFSLILMQQIQTISIEILKNYYRSVNECVNKIKDENREDFLRILETVLCAFLNKQLTDEHYSCQFSENDLKELLNIAFELSSTHDLQNRSCSLIIQYLLFKLVKNVPSKSIKIKYLFERLNNFDTNLCETNDPADIIKDEWLIDYIFHVPQDWLMISKNDYQNLSDIHHNNRWSIYIWSRIISLSLSTSEIGKWDEILAKLNEWMINVQHDIYNANDTLTIIFVKNIFEIVIFKHTKSVLSTPNIGSILQFILHTRQYNSHLIDIKQVDNFIENVCHLIRDILSLNSTRTTYLGLLRKSNIHYFLPFFDLENILTSSDPQQYKFPVTTINIDSIVSIQKPNDIDISKIDSKEEFLHRFILHINRWLEWYDKFIDIFQYIIERFKTWKLDDAEQLFIDIRTIKYDSLIRVIKIKSIIQQILKILKSFNNLQRLCDLFNCLDSFESIDTGSLTHTDQSQSYIGELKRLHTNTTFTVNANTSQEKHFMIDACRLVHWSFACEKFPCNIKVEYHINTPHSKTYTLFHNQNAPLHKQVLQGEFKTERNGNLIITIDNRNERAPQIIWYQYRTIALSTCHLFDGIFSMYYKKYSKQSIKNIKEDDLSKLIDQTFYFIDKLLNGEITLQEIDYLKTVFYDKNIDVKEEVKKLFANRSINDNKQERMRTTTAIDHQEIEQVCEWLRTYQYYSHLSIIIDCVQKFNIISNNESFDHLHEMIINENCSLKTFSETYKDLYERFRKLTNHHLQLIKIIIECLNVVEMMKKFDLYSTHGLRRFQELRDNLTTQFQLQERNNMILNSWIISYALCEPFVRQVKSLEEFVDNLAKLSNIDESSLKHIKAVNDNIQIVNMWLSTEETTMLDNALITMEHLYKTGIVNIHLKHLINEESYFEIEYSIGKVSTQITNKEDEKIQQQEKLTFTLSMTDIDDHKRQLTFCNVDLQQNMINKKILLNEQLKLLYTIEKIYLILVKLEKTGHPNFQLKEYNYEIYDRTSKINEILSDLKTNQNITEQQLEQAIQGRTIDFELIYRSLEIVYDMWIRDLGKYRNESRLLTLFSNRQVMIMIILLTISTTQNQIQQKFLEKLFPLNNFNNQQEEQFNLTILCLIHYLRSLRIKDCNLSRENIISLYNKYKIEFGSSTGESLKRLCSFLKDLFNNGEELLIKNTLTNENQQLLITLDTLEQTQNKKKFDNDFDMNTCCILLNIFKDRLPADYQILWCSISTEDDIRLFFLRVRTFQYLTFAVLDIDKMHHRLRELLLNEQDLLAKQSEPHGIIYYFSRELISPRKGLRPFYIKPQYRNPSQTYTQFVNLLQKNNIPSLEIETISGKAGIGKTHYIKTKYKDYNMSCVSINDKINLSLLISTFLSLESKISNSQPSIYFNISIHAPFKQLNSILFSLFICGSLNDLSSGFTFSPSITKPWKFIMEIPYREKSHMSIKENFDQILPILSIISTKTLEEIKDVNYQLFIGEEEELVARFLNAYENQTIDRLAKQHRFNGEQPVDFDRLIDSNECRHHIYNCFEKYAPELPRNKIFELSFTKFLYRRVRFFTGFFYRYNEIHERLGSNAMEQMINETKHLTQIDFSSDNYPRIFLVYDPSFSLHLLHNDWDNVPSTLKSLFFNMDPAKGDE
ncbi:unnamed protein product, partial [Rotaria sp. Silwood2]